MECHPYRNVNQCRKILVKYLRENIDLKKVFPVIQSESTDR